MTGVTGVTAKFNNRIEHTYCTINSRIIVVVGSGYIVFPDFFAVTPVTLHEKWQETAGKRVTLAILFTVTPAVTPVTPAVTPA